MRLYQKRKSNGERVWWATWTENGKTEKRSTKCSTRAAAEIVVARWERQRADPAYAAACEATLGTEAAEFLDDCRKRVRRRVRLGRVSGTLSEATLGMYEQKVGLLLNLMGTDTPLADIDAPRFAAYVKAREEHGAEESTIYKEWIALRGILKLARHNKRYHLVVSDVKPMHFSGASKPGERVLTWGEIARLLAELAPKRQAAVCFVLATGARLGEWERAQAGDISEDRGFVKLRGTKTAKSEGVVPVPRIFAPFLDRLELPLAPWGKSHQDLAAACGRASVCDEHRTTPRGKRGPKFHQRPVDGCQACKAMTMAPVTWNDLRRTFSTLLAEDGASPRVQAEMMRHTSTAMVDRHYTRLSPETIRQMLESQMGEPRALLGGGDPTNVRGIPSVSQAEPPLPVAVASVDVWYPQFLGEFVSCAVGQDRLELSANGLRGPCLKKGPEGESRGCAGSDVADIPMASQAEESAEHPRGRSLLLGSLSVRWFRRRRAA